MTNPTETLKETFDQDGFAVIRGLLAPEDVAEARSLIDPMFAAWQDMSPKRSRDIGKRGEGARDKGGQRQPEITRPTQLEDDLKNSPIMARLQEVASHLLGRPAYYTFDHAICKMPRSKTATAWHQDQAYLGQDIDLGSVNFWIPLDRVNALNGTLTYAPGSHRSDLKKHAEDPSSNPHALSMEKPDERLVTPSFELGDVAVHHPLTIHGAGPNETDAPRRAWAVHFSPYGRLGYVLPRNLAGTARRWLGKRKVAAS